MYDKAEINRLDECKAARELTVRELLDRRIEKAKTLARTLEDLKNSLSLSYLNSGCSRVTSLIEL